MLGENTALSEKTEDGLSSAKVLGERFVLETRLEQGRLGTVYRALDRLRGQDGRRYVAVLVLPSEIARNPEQLDAFERELDAVRGLSHPNIVRIFGLERDGENAFLVLEWVDGESLRSVIDSLAPESVCEADALGVVRAVGNALVYAHARGVVHGDIRPENVLVTERGEVRLLFSSACLARAAPFQIGPRDDVRGLASLAYELMSGSPPHIPGLYSRDKADEPGPIEGLSRKRWKALKSALSMRDGRISSVRKLLAALELPQPRAPRRGSRPDRIRDSKGGVVKRIAMAAVLLAGIAAVIVGGARIWNERGDSLPDFSALSASVAAGADRAAAVTRESLSSARAGLERANSALTGWWNDAERRGNEVAVDANGAPAVVSNEAPAGAAERTAAEGIAEAGAGANADDAVRGSELFEAKEFNDVPAAQAPDAGRGAAAEQSAVQRAAGEQAAEQPAPGDQSAADAQRLPADAERPAADAERPAADAERPAADAQRPADDPGIAFARREYVVAESGAVAAIEVAREDARGDVSFVWWTSDASAASGDDYADLGRQVEQLRDGEAVRMLYVPITSDSIVEDRREYFEVHLGVLSDEGNQNGALESARVTIVDDDR